MLVLLGPQKVKAQDEPTSVVARISVVHGDVSIMRGDSKEWVPATANVSVVRGDTLAAGADSRAEVQFDYANVLRLGQGAEVKVAELTTTRIQIQVASGLAEFVKLNNTEAYIEIDSPNTAIHSLVEGIYRIQVKSADYAQLTVRQGHAQVSTPQGSMNVDRGQVIEVKGTNAPEYQLTQAGEKDDWDRWNDERDHTIADAQSWQHTSRYYTGSEDLDRYGDWVQVAGYDWCWAPFVAAGWAPYRDGRWVSDPIFDWTWVGYEPWGWAPYHYGRWLFYDNRWCWWPGVGSNGPRPIWGPGYVAFFGFGGGSGGNGSAPVPDSIGWCPLGPRDRLNPWWGRGGALNGINVYYIKNISMTSSNAPTEQPYSSNLLGILTNAQLRSAITTVSAENFANGRIPHNPQPVDEDIFRQGIVMRGALPVAPTKTSLQPVDRPVSRAALPATAAIDQHFYTRSPVPARRAPLPAEHVNPPAEDPLAVGNVPARTGSMAPPDVAAPSQSPTIGAPAARPMAAPPESPTGWRRFSRGTQSTYSPAEMNKPGALGPPKSEPTPQNVQPPRLPPAPQGDQRGWRHFGSQPANPGAGEGHDGWRHFDSRPGGSGSSPAPHEI